MSNPRAPRPDEVELELDLEGSAGGAGPGPTRPAFSPFANPRAVVPVAVATQTRPNLDQPVPPPELIPLDHAGLPTSGPRGIPDGALSATVPARAAPGPGGASFDADLDLPVQPARSRPVAAPAPPRAPAPAPAAAASASTDPSSYFGSGTFDEDSLGGRSIEPTGHGGGPLDYFGGGTFGDDDFDGFSQSNALSLSVEHAADGRRTDDAGARWPTGRSPDPATLRPDAVEIALAADYGTAPSAPWMAPLYAIRVLVRQRALRPLVAEKKAALDAAEIERDDRIAEAVQAVRSEMENDDNLGRMLAPVREKEAIAAQRRDAVTSTNADYGDQVARLNARQQELEAQLSAKRAEERRHADVLAVAEEPHRKATIHHKRLQIELRSLNQVAQNAAKTGASLAPDHVEKVRRFEAQGQEVEAQLRSLSAEVEKARTPLLAVQREISGLERSLRDLAAQRRGLDAEFQKQLGARSEGLEAATRELRQAFAEAGRALLATRGALPIPDANVDAIRTADELVLRRSLELELYLRALDSCDREVVRRGWLVLAVAAGVLVLLVVLLVAL